MTNNNTATEKTSAKFFLGLVALFLGELRDGLTMINMQSAFLIVSKSYTEKQAGILFFVFGISQFLFQTPAGYIMDYTDWKVGWLAFASITTTLLTLLTATTATEYGGNIGWMIFLKFLQGGVTALIPPGLNSITQGIVGSDGMTRQVSDNEMRNHFGTAIIVLAGSLIAFFKYPEIGMLFIVSPLACAGVIFFLLKINPSDIDHGKSFNRLSFIIINCGNAHLPDAARGLKNEYNLTEADGSAPLPNDRPAATPFGKEQTKSPLGNASFAFSSGSYEHNDGAESPLTLLKDTTLLIFIVIVFFFHMSNGTILPLVMQTLAIGDGGAGILMAGLCIILAQFFMVGSAKVCGDYSGVWGRKKIFLIGLFSVPVRCLILFILSGIKNAQGEASLFLQIVILSTQIFDGVGAGVFGTMYILVTSDISAGTGRFSLTLGMTTAAMSIGGTVSGYLGQALAQDLGYQKAFMILGVMACIPSFSYLFFMPETLNSAKKSGQEMSVIAEESQTGNEDKRTIV